MATTVVTTRGTNLFDVPVVFEGLQVSVGPGEVKFGEAASVLGLETYTIAGAVEGGVLAGFLVKELSTGDMRLVVEERVKGQPKLRVDYQELGLTMLCQVFVLSYPPGVADLSNCDVTLYKCAFPVKELQP
jgi:hypothetical protein